MSMLFLRGPISTHQVRSIRTFRHCVALAAVLGFSVAASADVLYTTISGATASTAQPAYSSSLNLTGNVSNAGPYGFGDDYKTPYVGLSGAAIKATDSSFQASNLVNTDQYIQVSSISYYGDLEPGPNGTVTTGSDGSSLYSLGATLKFVFFDSSGAVDYSAQIRTPTGTSNGANTPLTPSPYQGPGFHQYTFSPVYIPVSGYVVLQPALTSKNGGNGSTPIGTVPPSFSGFFGNAPTVGSSAANVFTTLTADPNNPNDAGVVNYNSTFSNLPNPTPSSPDAAGDSYTYTSSPSGTASSGYLQIEFDGTGLGGVAPEPTSSAMFAAAAAFGLVRRSRKR